MDFTALFAKLPWSWCVTVLCNIGWFFIAKMLWNRLNDLQDKRVADVQDYSDKLHTIIDTTNQTVQNLLTFFKGGK
jgi:cell division protein FtsW (lipid II flippase)